MVTSVCADGVAVAAQAVGHLAQDAMHFAHLLFGEPHQFVVQVDGFERLDEQRVAAGAGAVDHAIELAALPGDHRHHEALVADGDELFLQHAFFAVRFAGSARAIPEWTSSAARCRGAGGRARRWRGRRRCHRAGSCHPVPAAARGNRRWSAARRARRGKRSAAAVRSDLGVGRAIEQREQVEDFLAAPGSRLRCAACERRLRCRAGRRNRCGWRRRARRAAGARPCADIRWPRRLRRDRLPGAARSACGSSFSSSRRPSGAGDVAAEQLPQRFEFEYFSAGSQWLFISSRVRGRPFQSRRACLR